MEDFSLRADIHFKDSKKTVSEKDPLKPYSVSGYASGWSDGSSEYLGCYGTVSGYDDTRITYRFNNLDELEELEYNFGLIETSKSDADKMYNNLYDGLVRKYGEPYSNSLTHSFPVVCDSFVDACTNANWALSRGANGGLSHLSEWIVYVEDGNYYVKIDLSCDYFGAKKLVYEVFLGYKIFYDSDIDAVLQDVKDAQKIIDNDL